jgi:hypothetical protein
VLHPRDHGAAVGVHRLAIEPLGLGVHSTSIAQLQLQAAKTIREAP